MAGREPYSPKSRTALVLTGTGTAGAYHAGVLKALTEAGIRIDIVAGLGVGVVAACFAAIDGAAPLWKPDGFWRQKGVAGHYPWRRVLRWLGTCCAAAAAVVAIPLVLLALGALVYPVAFLLRLARLNAANALSDGYAALVHEAFLPDRLLAWTAHLALAVMLVGLATVGVAALRGRMKGRYREHGGFWWRALGAPLSAQEAIDFWCLAMWRLISGGAKAPQPDPVQLSRRYSELLSDNLGQPGFRELIALVHDLDARRDLVMAVLAQPYRASFFGRRRPAAQWAERANETVDLAGADRDHVTDALAAALCIPVVTPAWPVTFAPESYWQGETHRLCDRPDAIFRLLEEVQAAGAEQVIVVSATPAPTEAHTLRDPRIDGRGRVGEWLASRDTAAMRDALAACTDQFLNIHVIRPDHNPVGPLDVAGTHDSRSDRPVPLAELIEIGYADAQREFIGPVIGAADGNA